MTNFDNDSYTFIDSINVFDWRLSSVVLDSYIVYLEQDILIGVFLGVLCMSGNFFLSFFVCLLFIN